MIITAGIRIDISELRHRYGGEIEELLEFLGERLDAKIDTTAREIDIKPDEKGWTPSKNRLRVLLRKFLHQRDLKEEFRIIVGREGSIIIKERKSAREAE